MDIKHLNQVNDVEIKSVFDPEFKTFGQVIKEYDFSDLIEYMENSTDIPESGNVYVASVADMEKMPVAKQISDFFYGGMPVEIGYCNGKNSTYNGFEYHKCSEINIAVTDFMLVLGHTWDIENHCYKMEDATVFFVPKGTAIEMYQTTLHLSPCKVTDQGFKGVVVLAKGTNTPLENKPVDWKKCLEEKGSLPDCEEVLLLQKNKWVLAHKDRKPLIDQGAYPGAVGENRELKY